MRIGLFGGSFDPVHAEHVRYVRAAAEQLNLDKVFVLPSHIAPHKRFGAFADERDRLEMCRIAFRKLPFAEVSDYEIAQGGTSYSYLTCRHFSEKYPESELFFLVGADMLEDFFTWKNPDELLSYATLAACGRADEGTDGVKERFFARFGKRFVQVDFAGEDISSTQLRTDLAFGKDTPALDKKVAAYIREKGLYSHPAIAPALALEKPARKEHSYRVAVMATGRARSLGIPEEKALLAAALHDCAKYVPPESPLLKGFTPPEGVPSPVLHQFAGAYLAEHEFGIADEEILDAIRFHTSGRADMGKLEKLIYLSDMLESERDFPHVEELRKLFYKDLDECLYASLSHTMEYLAESGKPVYPLTEEAYRFMKNQFEKKENV